VLRRNWVDLLFLGVLVLGVTSRALGQDPAGPKGDASDNIPVVSLFDGVRTGELAVKAEGRGDGQMTLSITNHSNRRLRVVLPSSLIASSATAQFGGGGFGGFGGGGFGGGMGGMGGGMGGVGGGMMGGMGGGMGGMGGGMGGMGGGMMGGGTMPASTGMIMLGRLIMNLTGEKESWDFASLYTGSVGGGTGMMGSTGGGLAGGAGGGMGMMGGGFRSMPPTGPPSTVVAPGQTRNLPTRLVNLSGPGADMRIPVPAQGEPLQILDGGSDPRMNPRLQAAMTRLAAEKAPETVSQLVMWHIGVGLDWSTLTKLSGRWANAGEMALAKHFVAQFDAAEGKLASETGTLYYDLTADDPHQVLINELTALFKDHTIIGLNARNGIPSKPPGPALSCRVRLTGSDAIVQVWTTDPTRGWVSAGKFTLALPQEQDTKAAATVADAWAEGMLARLVRVQLTVGPKVKGKESYKIRIDNVSPLILNGLALAGKATSDEKRPTALASISLPPKKSLTVPVAGDVVERLGFKNTIRVLAADLSAL
jgi:hypothetical protein